MLKNKLYLLYLLSSCFGIFLLLSVLISRLIAYFETPEINDSTITITSKNSLYQPHFEWMPLNNEGRKMEVHNLTKITEDYLISFYDHNSYLLQDNADHLHDHFTKNSRPKVKLASLSSQNDQRVEYTTLTHKLDLKLYADDGTIVVLDDIQVNYHQLYENNQMTGAYYDTAKFEVMLLLEDNFWRIRHKIRSNVTQNITPIVKDTVNEYVTVSQSRFSYGGTTFRSRGINYYPADYPWDLFWPNFSKIPLDQDFQLISDAGFNTIRVFVPFQQFGGASVTETELKHLKTLLDKAQTHHLKVIVTLFDFFLGYAVNQWTLSERHAETIVKGLQNHPAIMAWDIKNEPDLDFETHGEERVKEWLKFMSLTIRKYDPNHLITVGWSTPEYLSNIDSSVDYYSFHYYKNPADLKNYIVKELKKPVILEETGQHSFNAWWYPFRKSDDDQKEYIEEILPIISEYNLSYTFWTLYDFHKIPDNVVGTVHWRKGIQKNFGLIDKKNNPKPAFEIIKKYNLKKN